LGYGENDGVRVSSYIYDPSSAIPDTSIYSATDDLDAFTNIDVFNDAIQNIINDLSSIVDDIVSNDEALGGEKWTSNDFPDPIAQELYNNPKPNFIPPSATPGAEKNGANVVYGKDLSGSPGNPQTTFASNDTSTSGQNGLSPSEILSQNQQNNDSQKKHRKGLGRNETLVDVVNIMSRALSTIDSNRIKYATKDGDWAMESRNDTLDRLIGLKTSQLPLSMLSKPTDSSGFARYVYELIRDKNSSAIIEGKELTGKDLAIKYGKELAEYIDILDGNNIEAIREAAMAKNNTGVEFVPHSLEQSVSISMKTQKTIDGGTKTERTRDPDTFPDAQVNQVNFVGNIVPPKVFKETYKDRLDLTYETPMSRLDYLNDRRNDKRDNEANKAISTLTESSSDTVLSDTYFAILNSSGFDALNEQIEKQERVQIYNARRHAGGSYYDLLINAKGLESDPNTVTLRRIVASFSATLLCLKAQCSECKHYKGSKEKSQGTSQNGSAILKAALSCEYGYTDPGGKAKAPDSFCGSAEYSAANPAVTGIRYELNDEISNRIREARNAIEKDGSDAYLALQKQYKQTSSISVSPEDAASSAGTTSGDVTIPDSLKV